MADEAKEFWNAFETETGEKVEARSIGECFRDKGPTLWGLLVLTDKSFRFRYMPSDNWFSSLFKKGPLGKSQADEPLDIAIPLEELEAEVAERKGFFARLTGPAFTQFSAKRRGEERVYRFSADPGSGFIKALKAVGRKG